MEWCGVCMREREGGEGGREGGGVYVCTACDQTCGLSR